MAFCLGVGGSYCSGTDETDQRKAGTREPVSKMFGSTLGFIKNADCVGTVHPPLDHSGAPYHLMAVQSLLTGIISSCHRPATES